MSASKFARSRSPWWKLVPYRARSRAAHSRLASVRVCVVKAISCWITDVRDSLNQTAYGRERERFVGNRLGWVVLSPPPSSLLLPDRAPFVIPMNLIYAKPVSLKTRRELKCVIVNMSA